MPKILRLDTMSVINTNPNPPKDNPITFQSPILTATNYNTWAIKMEAIMDAHGLWDAVEPPTGVVVDEKKSKQARAFIFQSIPEEILSQAAKKKTAKEVWDSLKSRYVGAERVKKARLRILKSEFEGLYMKDGESIDDYTAKLSGMISRYSSVGATLSDEELVRKLFDTVPEKFINLVASIEQSSDVESMLFEEAIGHLKAYEDRLKLRKGNCGGESTLLLTKSDSVGSQKGSSKTHPTAGRGRGGYNQSRGSRSGSRGRGASRGRGGRWGGGSRQDFGNTNRRPKDKSHIKCFECNNLGHYASECKQGKKHDEEVNLAQEQEDEATLLLSVCGEETLNMVLLNEEKVVPSRYQEPNTSKHMWYLDNGASNHMTGLNEVFAELDEKITGQVRFGDGSKVEIKGRGTILFNCKNGDQFILPNVYYIPALHSNVISLGQMTEDGYNVGMRQNYLRMYDAKGRLVMKVERSANRLYKILLTPGKPICLAMNLDQEEWVWHARMGHANFGVLQSMARKEMVDGMPYIDHPSKVCEGCLIGKQVRQSFPAESTWRAKEPLQLIHADLCGPITPCSKGGNKYFFLLVDDYSRFMWVYLLKSKDEALMRFKKFKAKVEKESSFRIKMLRTDRGGEFNSHKFSEFCSEAGIRRQLTAPYTPQQNGVVERRNRTIVEMTRTILKSMKVPDELWAEAVRHSVFLLNRIGTKSVRNRTPYEAWKSSKPTLEHVRIFGCVAYVKKLNEITKLSDRSEPMVHLGIEEGSKAYRLLNPKTNKIVVARDVVFDEVEHWNWDPVPQQEPPGNCEGNNSTRSETASAPFDDTPPQGFRSMHDVEQRSTAMTDDEVRDLYDRNPELLLLNNEPMSYDEAAKDQCWRKAMEQELDSINRNRTWRLVNLPAGQKAIGLKWVFKLKKDPNGTITKHKARLVAKGYVQKKGVDFDEAFAPVARLETVRLLLAMAAKERWLVHHLDVKSAFLNGDLKEEVYVQQPAGFEIKGKETQVYRLNKALYGLRQAPRAWNLKLDQSLKKMGFTRCSHDQAVYKVHNADSVLIVGVYVDDLIVTGSNESEILEFKEKMKRLFEMSDLGLLTYYLGIEVSQKENEIIICQEGYAKRILEAAGMQNCNSAKCPMEFKLKLCKDDSGKPTDATKYRSIIGSLRYLINTRPDLSYSVGALSKYLQNPKESHYAALKQVLRYLKGTVSHGLKYNRGGDGKLVGYSDSSHGTDLDDRRGTTGMVFYYAGKLITWASQKQQTVALSSCEAEFLAATSAACQGLWLRSLISELSGEKAQKVKLLVDNESAIALMKNSVFHGRSKHIDIKFHFIRECVERDQIGVEHVSGDLQKADMLTKALAKIKFAEMRELVGVEDLKTVVNTKGVNVG
ncbi:putative RNA-directed DNA polymerase [Helianthus annuus]|nr:putative RNA-directed DNA polymerase [Helianthus annuus]